MMKTTKRKVQRKRQSLNQSHKSLPSIRQPFYAHIQELRSRLLWCITALVASSAVGYWFHESILNWLIDPLHGPLFYTSPVGGFNFVLQVSIFFGFLVSLPVFVYHILKFIEPIIPHSSKALILKLLFFSLCLLLLGVIFAYYVSLPAALHFLGEFGSDQVKSLISTNEYLSFVTHYLLGFGILFQLPLILIVINRFQKLTVKRLLRFQRYVIVVSFILAAVITPTPDFINQTIMAVPLIILYYGSLALIYFLNK